jgi:hypothetical protein
MDKEKERESTSKEIESEIIYNQNQIIIPSKEQSYQFVKGSFRSKYLEHIIKKEEYDSIIKEASYCLENSWVKKRENDQIKTPKTVTVLIIISVALMMLYMVLIYFSAKVENGATLLILSLICVSVGSVIALGLAVHNFCRKIGKFISLDEIIKTDIDNLFNRVNKKYEGELLFQYECKNRRIIVNILKRNDKGDREEKEGLMNKNSENDSLPKSKGNVKLSSKNKIVYEFEGVELASRKKNIL